MASQLAQDNRVATLKTPLGENVLAVNRFDAGEGLSELFEYRVEALSENGTLDFDDAIGEHCSVTLTDPDGQERIFDGILVETQWLGKTDALFAYRLVLKPWLWLLSRTTDCQIFSELSVPDIVQKIFTEAGFTDFELNLSENYDPLEYCVQYRETDLAFVSRLMEMYGIYYYHKHEVGKHTVVLADAKSSHDAIPGRATIDFMPAVEQERSAQDYIFRISAERRFRTGRVTLNDYDYEKPGQKLICETSAGAGYAHSDMEFYDYPGKYTKTQDGDHFAKVRLQAEQAMDTRRHAAGGVAAVFPGGLFQLQKHPVGADNIEYLVVRATHAFVAQSYRSTLGDGPGESYIGTYELLPSEVPFRAPLLTERPIVHGPQTAKVVGKAGEEIDVDKEGRITVQFYWDRQKNPSCPVRIAQVWSGKAWGGIFIPRIDQEVVVVFLEGDPDRPLVVGTVYNGDNTVPYDLPANKTMGGIKSDSSKGHKGYNEIVFEDKKNSEILRAHAQKDLELKVLNDETRDITHDSKTTVGHDIEVTAGDKITITAGTSIELKVGTNNVFIDGTGVKINGVAQINLKSPMTEVHGDAILTLQGGLVLIN
jgi:type VI secretion system secreted protein VgrG